jgi:transposase
LSGLAFEIAGSYNVSVPKTAELVLSSKQLERIYAELESRFESKYASRIEELEQKCERLELEAARWKKRFFAEQKRAEGLQGKLELAQVKIKELEALVERQRAQIEQLQQQVHGKKPETLPPPPSPEDQPKRGRGKQSGAKGKGRKIRLEIEPVDCVHDFPAEQMLCQVCGSPYEEISEKTSEEIHVEYALVRRIHRRKTVRKTCTCSGVATVKTAPGPFKLFPKSLFSVETWGNLLFDKYHLQRPLNRIRQWLESLGLKDVSQGTLTNGLKKLYDNEVFKPLYEDIHQRVSSAEHQQKDETGWKVFQDTEGKVGYSWFLWVTLGRNCTFFEIEPNRSREIAQHTIGTTPVVLSSDCYGVYRNMAPNVTNAWCWAHIRRSLHELRRFKGLATMSSSWVKKVDTLYHFNNLRIAASPEDFEKHDRLLKEAIGEFERHAKRNAKRVGMHEEASAVFRSIAKHWDGLTVFVRMPGIPMDNNASERAIRGPVTGRKVYYGSGSHWSARLTAQLFSIFASLEQNGINPRVWLIEYLHAIARNGGKPPANATSFLPWNTPDTTLLE